MECGPVECVAECPKGYYANPTTGWCHKCGGDNGLVCADAVPCAEGGDRCPDTCYGESGEKCKFPCPKPKVVDDPKTYFFSSAD